MYCKDANKADVEVEDILQMIFLHVHNDPELSSNIQYMICFCLISDFFIYVSGS